MNSMELLTERCRVRPFRPEDADALHAALSDPEVMRHVEPPFTLDRTRAFVREVGLCAPPRVFAVVWRATGRVIGHVIFHAFDGADYEIGWVLRRDFWGMGIADELTRALLLQAGRQGAEGCVIECVPEQTASRRIALRHGFAYVGRADGLDRYRRAL